MRRVQAGFTLIELLVVVAIVGILAAIAMPKLTTAREQAYWAALKSSLRSLAAQQEIYYNRHSQYTANLTSLEFDPGTGINVAAPTLSGGSDSKQGWTASATHNALPTGQGCVIYGGLINSAVTAAGATAHVAGQTACAE